jgi:hypothetical protein
VTAWAVPTTTPAASLLAHAVLFRGDPGWRAIGGLLIYPLHAFAALIVIVIVIVIVLASLLLAVAGAVGRGPHRRATRMRQ